MCGTCNEKGLVLPLASMFAVVEGSWMLMPAVGTEPQCCIELVWPFQYSTFWRTHPFSNAPASPFTASPARDWPARAERACKNTLPENVLKKPYPIHSCDKDKKEKGNVTKWTHSLEEFKKVKMVSCCTLLLVTPLDLVWVQQGTHQHLQPDGKFTWKTKRFMVTSQDFKIQRKKKIFQYSQFALPLAGGLWGGHGKGTGLELSQCPYQ